MASITIFLTGEM